MELTERKNDTDDSPVAAKALSKTTGEPVEKYTPSNDVTLPHPEDLESVKPEDVE